jgi:hypothetical protein
MTEHRLKKVLVYFNLVSDARRFARELPHTLRLLARTDPGLVPDITPELFFAHGEHTPAQRADTFAAFAAADCAILANSKLIAEGVDIPSVDAIVFADPTRSVIRCVQALGRALRLDVSGKTASLIVPVYIPPGADGENILGTPYEPVWAIACALAGHDHRILERLPDKANRLPRETSTVIQRRWHFDFTVHPERIAQAMDLVSFDPREAAVSRSRRLGLASAQCYRDQYGHLDVPADHVDPTGYRLGTFITTMRDAAKAGRLEADCRAELDVLGMIWDKHDAAWRSRLAAAADYHRAHGHLAAPATTPVGAWLAEQRHLAAKSTLDQARADALSLEQIALQLTGHARAVASGVRRRADQLPKDSGPKALADVVLREAEGRLSAPIEGTVRCVQNRARLVRALYERLDRPPGGRAWIGVNCGARRPVLAEGHGDRQRWSVPGQRRGPPRSGGPGSGRAERGCARASTPGRTTNERPRTGKDRT